jgi:hypothetical protein
MSKSCLFQVTDWDDERRVFFEKRIRYDHIYEPVLILMSKLAFEVMYYLLKEVDWFVVRAIVFKLTKKNDKIYIWALELIYGVNNYDEGQTFCNVRRFQQKKCYILDNSFLLDFENECSEFQQNYMRRIHVRNWWCSIVYHYCLERRGVNDCILEFDEFCECDLI